MKAYISGLGVYVPKRRMSNNELAKIVDTSDEWIFSHTGIRNRHIAAENEAASDLAIPAAKHALDSAGIKPEDLDLILVATSTPDYISMPSTACVVQNALGAEFAGAMDITVACSGFVYGLETAKNFVIGGARHVLLIGTEVYSKIMNWEDRNTCVLFGDGASAVVVSPASDENISYVKDSILRSEGVGAEALVRSVGGTRKPLERNNLVGDDFFLAMNGRMVYNFAVRALSTAINEILDRNNLSLNDIKYIVPHQANIRIINAAAKRLGVNLDLFYKNMDEYANTSAASIGIALKEMLDKGLLQRGDIIVTVGFGAGLTYGANVMYW